MGFDEGRIVLDNGLGFYYSGQTVYGKLIFDQEKPKKFRKMYAHMKGYCKVYWTTTRSRRVNNRTVYTTVPHESYEEYFNLDIALLENKHGEYHLEPGHHEIPFQCVLPLNCPSSMEGAHGHIRYEIKIIIDRSFKFNQEKIVQLSVFCLKDLNLDEYAKEPIAMEFNESYCCCCMVNGNCQTLVKLPVSGYCPGQVIPVELSCNNNSTVKIDKVKFKLKRETTYHATRNPATKTQEETLLQIKRGPIPANTTRNWKFDIEIPAFDVCNVSTCQFIDVEHSLSVKVESEGCHDNSHDNRRLVLGNVPIRGFQDDVENPLRSQMPTNLPQAIVTQPVSSQSLNANLPYPPANSPYPPANSHASANQPYPPVNSPYPPTNSPYPPANPPYPPTNSPYPPTNSPYPPTNSPYPTANSPYPPANSTQSPVNLPHPPEKSPYPGANSSDPTSSSPYPPTGSPYPGVAQPYSPPGNDLPPPYPGLSLAPAPYPAVEKSPIGFSVMPSLPPGAAVPYPISPYASASAPEPSTPGCDIKKPPSESDATSGALPDYNPNFDKQGDEKK